MARHLPEGRFRDDAATRVKESGLPCVFWGVERRRQEFTEFYASARVDCLRIVLVSIGDRQLAEDLVAEAFTRAWMSWRRVREHPVPRAWVVVRTALNTLTSSPPGQ